MQTLQSGASVRGERPGLWLAIGIFLIWGAAMAAVAGITLILPRTWLDRVWVLNPRGHSGLMAAPKVVAFLFPVLGLALLSAGVGWLRRRFWGWMLAVLLISGNLDSFCRWQLARWISRHCGRRSTAFLYGTAESAQFLSWRPVNLPITAGHPLS